MNEILGILIAAVLSWLNFVIIDVYMGLPEQAGVKGAKIVGESVQSRGGDIAGGFFQGNILCSPDASAGTLLASIGYLVLGIPGGIIASFLVFSGNRLCSDPGYAGSLGALTITVIIFLTSFIGLKPEMFIIGMVLAITTIQGLSHVHASNLIGKIAKVFNRHT